jgi:hypothetical protein
MRIKPIITICSSTKFFATAKALAQALAGHGVEVRTPSFAFDEDGREMSPAEKRDLQLSFLDKVRTCDIVYVIGEGGYTGVSVCVEIGYAYALGKRIVLSEYPIDPAIAALTDGYIPTNEFVGYFADRHDDPAAR